MKGIIMSGKPKAENFKHNWDKDAQGVLDNGEGVSNQ